MSLFSDALASMRPSRTARPRRDGYNWSLPTIRQGRIDLVAELTASYAQIYHQQPWVHAATNRKVRSVGMLPLHSYQRDGMERERITQGRLPELMARPARTKTPTYWKQHLMGSTIVWGNAIFVKLGIDSPEQIPDEIFPAPAIGWSLGENDTYVWSSEKGEMFPFERWQIIHFMHWDTDQNGFGVSALEPLRRTLAVEDAATRFGIAAFKNGVNPASVVQTDQTLGNDVLKRLKENIKNLYGGVDQAFRVAVLEQGLDWKPLSHNLQDAALLDHRKLSREEVAAVIDVPQPTMGILENANFASLRELHQMLYQDSLGPELRMAEETLKTQFIDLIPEFEDQFVEFNLDMVLRGDINSRALAYQRFISSGVRTQNECRRLENLPPSDQPQADQLHIPLNLGPDPSVGESNSNDPVGGGGDGNGES